MPRVKILVNRALQESIEREIKDRYGPYISRNELRQYLRIGKNRTDVFDQIPTYNITPGKINYRAVDVAAWLAQRCDGVSRLY